MSLFFTLLVCVIVLELDFVIVAQFLEADRTVDVHVVLEDEVAVLFRVSFDVFAIRLLQRAVVFVGQD